MTVTVVCYICEPKSLENIETPTKRCTCVVNINYNKTQKLVCFYSMLLHSNEKTRKLTLAESIEIIVIH